jgi:hypothetical protein
VLPWFLVSPEYVATIEKVPVFENAMEQDAAPAVSLTAPQLGSVLPFRVNFTVPVAVLGVTVAVNFTEALTTDGFLLETSFVVVVPVPPLTTCESAVLVLPAYLESPE